MRALFMRVLRGGIAREPLGKLIASETSIQMGSSIYLASFLSRYFFVTFSVASTLRLNSSSEGVR
jgi:hypothetical protein